MRSLCRSFQLIVRERGKSPALRPELLQAAEHFISLGSLGGIKLRVWYHYHRPAHAHRQHGSAKSIRRFALTSAPLMLKQTASMRQDALQHVSALPHGKADLKRAQGGHVSPKQPRTLGPAPVTSTDAAPHLPGACGAVAPLSAPVTRGRLQLLYSINTLVTQLPTTMEDSVVAAHMPAAFAATTPVGASSKTRHSAGAAGGENPAAAARKMSGSGLPRATWSPAGPVPSEVACILVLQPGCLLHSQPECAVRACSPCPTETKSGPSCARKPVACAAFAASQRVEGGELIHMARLAFCIADPACLLHSRLGVHCGAHRHTLIVRNQHLCVAKHVRGSVTHP